MKLTNRVAIVTGATQGIGLACAQRLITEGAKVMLVDIKPEGAQAAEALGDQARFFAADVSQKADVDALVAATLAAFGRIRHPRQQRGRDPTNAAFLTWRKTTSTACLAST